MAFSVSISPQVADEEDHSAKSKENQTLPLAVVSANTCRTRWEAVARRVAKLTGKISSLVVHQERDCGRHPLRAHTLC